MTFLLHNVALPLRGYVKLEDVVRVGLLIREDADLKAGFGAWVARAGKLKNPPTVTTAIVSQLANPDYLIEIEATAVLS